MVEKKMFIYFYRNGKTSKEELVVKFDENAGKNYNIQLTHHQIDTFKDDYNNGDFRRYIGALINLLPKLPSLTVDVGRRSWLNRKTALS